MCQARLSEKSYRPLAGSVPPSTSSTYIKEPKDVSGGGTTIYPYYRVGYDGQKKVLSSQYAVVVLSSMLPLSVNSMIDAYKKIYKMEGFGGLYRGFWISSIQIVSGVFYVSTYEGVRHFLGQDPFTAQLDSRIKALIGGGAASVVGQTIVVPFDVLSQHLMVLGVSTKHGKLVVDKMGMNPLGLTLDPGRSRAFIAGEIVRLIYQRDGPKGFYRGYVASLCAYVPNSALWWGLYTFYQDEMVRVLPVWVSHLLIQAVAGTLGGFTTTIITNPLDIVRARLQVQRLDSMCNAFKVLWVEEGFQMFTKGLSARLVQSACFSFSIILGYETIKRVSIIEEYKSYVRW